MVPAEQGGCVIGPECIALMLFYLCCGYAVNALSPKLAGKLQTTATVIKFIPLTLMAVVGIVYGLTTGQLASNFANPALGYEVIGNPLFAAVCATAFAYEGWIIATSINSELKDSKRNLPKALIIGGLIIIATYLFYYIGVAGGASNDQLIREGATVAFLNIFGKVFGNVLNLFVAISCLGTMNGLMLGCVRGLYSLAARKEGPRPEIFSQVDSETNMAHNSSVVGLLMCGFWGLYFYLANLAGTWQGAFVFDSSELPIITIYAMYIPIFIQWIRKQKDESVLRRFILPILSICGAVFMVAACILGHGMACVWYLIVFAVFMLVGVLLNRKKTA